MGYGPAVKNRFGWCYRNEHGNGIRMTPYFKTEEMLEKFHDYFTENIQKYSSKSLLDSNIFSGMTTFMSNFADLRIFKLKDVNTMADDFLEKNSLKKKKVIVTPKKETLYEFYGCDMEEYCAYEEN